MTENKNRKKILLTGGHASSTVYAVTEEIKEQKLYWDLVFVGAKSSLEGKRVKTLAEINFKNSSVKTYFINAGRVQRKFGFWTIPSLIKIPFGFIQALTILIKEKPDAILSFGGFVSYPLNFWGYMLRIPVILHEQTSVAGRSNIYSAKFASKIALARESSKKFFPINKCEVVGNPISKEVLSIVPKKEKNKPPTIFVHGGQSGSSCLNNVTSKVLEKVLKNFRLLHQTGQKDEKRFNHEKSRLPSELKSRYEVIGVIKSESFYKYLKKADIIISRSGANFSSEIMVSKIPSILVPIPYSYLNEQNLNAKYLKEIGLAKVIDQEDLTSEKLLMLINELNENWYNIIGKVSKFKSPDKDASKKLVDIIRKYL